MTCETPSGFTLIPTDIFGMSVGVLVFCAVCQVLFAAWETWFKKAR